MQKPNTNFPGVYFRDILHGIYPNPNKLTHLNQRFQSVPKQVCTVTRTHIFYRILYVGILRMYTIVHIFLVHFSITGTIKNRTHSWIEVVNRSIRKKSASNRSSNNTTIYVSYLPPNSFLIFLSTKDAVTSTNIYMIP